MRHSSEIIAQHFIDPKKGHVLVLLLNSFHWHVSICLFGLYSLFKLNKSVGVSSCILIFVWDFFVVGANKSLIWLLCRFLHEYIHTHIGKKERKLFGKPITYVNASDTD